MNNRQTGGIPTKVRMPPVFEIMILAKFLKIAQLQEITYLEVALFGNVLRRNTVPCVLRRCNRGQNANQQAALFRGTVSVYLFMPKKTAQEAESLQGKALDTGRISYRQFRILQEKRRRMPTAHAAQPAETENVPLAQSADRREISKRQRFRQRALDKREIKTPDSYLRFFL